MVSKSIQVVCGTRRMFYVEDTALSFPTTPRDQAKRHGERKPSAVGTPVGHIVSSINLKYNNSLLSRNTRICFSSYAQRRFQILSIMDTDSSKPAVRTTPAL